MMIDLFHQLKKYIVSIIFIAMTIPAFTQNSPAVDRIKTSAGDLDMHFIGHGSLMFGLNNYFIYIDPVRSSGNYSNAPKADLILVTHEHYDHLDNELINTLRKESTVLICNKNSAENIPWGRVMKEGENTVVNNINIEVVPAYNIVNMRAPGQPFHPKGVGNGYILTIGDKRIYVAGDTENTPEMKAIKNIDVAFLPMNLPYTMTPEMVADAAKTMHPKILYPYHYGDTNTDKLVNLLKDTDIIVRIRDLK
jgi:L-ascorbate metabolism protein UlaG (beta-lactamase superfamily)